MFVIKSVKSMGFFKLMLLNVHWNEVYFVEVVVYIEMIKFIHENWPKKHRQVRVWREGRHRNAFQKQSSSNVFNSYLLSLYWKISREHICWTATMQDNLSKAAEFGIYRGSLKHEFLVISGVLLVWLLVV